MCDVPTHAAEYVPPLDHAEVLAVHNKLTVLLITPSRTTPTRLSGLPICYLRTRSGGRPAQTPPQKIS